MVRAARTEHVLSVPCSIMAAMTWPKGKTGNPNGRPPAGQTFADLIAKELNRVWVDPADERDAPPRRLTRKQKAVETAVRQAAQGNLNALIVLMERLEGKVTERVQMDVQHSVRVVPWKDLQAPGITYVPNKNRDDSPDSGQRLPPPDASDQTPPWEYKHHPEKLEEPGPWNGHAPAEGEDGGG